eukprot:1170505-Rhodomonas_salina.2
MWDTTTTTERGTESRFEHMQGGCRAADQYNQGGEHKAAASSAEVRTQANTNEHNRTQARKKESGGGRGGASTHHVLHVLAADAEGEVLAVNDTFDPPEVLRQEVLGVGLDQHLPCAVQACSS